MFDALPDKRLTALDAEQIVAVDVSAEDYMQKYAADHHEWVEGIVYRMSPATFRHIRLVQYLENCLEAYFALRPIGQVVQEPFVMVMEALNARREPDLMVILNENPAAITDTALLGAADICIEVVSPESRARDYSTKLTEYESAGVREYWIIDPLQQDCRFLRLAAGEDKPRYLAQLLTPDQHYETPLLPHLKLHVPTFWQDALPSVIEVVAAVRAMLPDASD